MTILFITARPYLPQIYGGLQTSTDELCYHLIERGREVAVLSTLTPNGRLGILSRVGLKPASYYLTGQVLETGL
jgi:hypothetical protein